MKILQVVPYFYPAYAFGGPLKMAYQISKGLVNRNHEVVVYTSDAKDLESRLTLESVRNIDGIKVHYMRNIFMMPVKKFKLFITPKLILRAKEEIKKFDVIHLHEYRSFQNIVVCHYAKKYGIPYVIQAHGSLSRKGYKKRFKWIFDVIFGYKLLRSASTVLALNKIEATHYKHMGVSEEKIKILPNGIDISILDDLPPRDFFRNKLSIKKGEKMILYLGRIHESKGLDILAKAFYFVSKNIEGVQLVVVGPDDGYKETFSNLISDLGLKKNTVITGFVGQQDKMSAFIDSDVFVTPHYSGFPLTFLEACLFGCPIITTTNELDWIHNSVGYVVQNSPESLAKGIITILKDESVQKKFKENSIKTIKRFSILNILHNIQHIYQNIVGE